MKHAFSIDLEDWYHGIEMPVSEWKHQERRLEKGMDVVLELLSKYKTKATFFTLGIIGKEYPELVKKIADEGHEIACHSYQHDKVYDLSPEKFREDTLRAKETLEAICGTEVLGYRAPYFSITQKSIWALEILKDLGFSYDCSISPIVTWRYGIANSPKAIYSLSDLDLIEFPLTGLRYFFRDWGTGGAYLRVLPFSVFKKAFHRQEKKNEPTMFYAHPWEYDPGHPKVQMERKAQFTHYHNLNQMKSRTEQLLARFSFGTVSEVLNEYQGRKQVAQLSSADLIA